MDASRRNRTARRYGRLQFVKGLGIGAAGLAVAGTANLTWADAASAAPGRAFGARNTLSVGFDFENGSAPIEVVIPNVVPVIFATVSSSAMDATLVLRITTFLTNAWFDAIAPTMRPRPACTHGSAAGPRARPPTPTAT